jgi:hypothetical protein
MQFEEHCTARAEKRNTVEVRRNGYRQMVIYSQSGEIGWERVPEAEGDIYASLGFRAKLPLASKGHFIRVLDPESEEMATVDDLWRVEAPQQEAKEDTLPEKKVISIPVIC